MANWIIDQAHSIIGFEVKHMMISTVRGQFDSFTATIESDNLTDLTTAKIAFTFDGESINTRNRERDKHLKSADFFDIRNYPTIDFSSTNIIRMGDNQYKVIGDLTIKDVTKPVTFCVEFGGRAINEGGVEVFGFHSEATINREDFGLVWNAALETGGFLVGKEVKIEIALELTQPNHVFLQPSDGEIQPTIENKHSDQKPMGKELQRMIVENITDLVLIINRSGVIQYATPSFNTLLNFDPTSLQNSNFFDKVHGDDLEIVREEIVSYFGRTMKRELKSEFRLLHKSGHSINVEANINRVNEPSFSTDVNELILIVMRDISERKEVEKAIYQLAFHDPLTNLLNRRSFMNQFRSEIMERTLTRSKLSVLFIDLDHFKLINDQWGHDTGDLVLKEAAKRIQSVIRPTDMVARFGGDEFVVILKDVENEEDAITVAERLLTQFQKPINQTGQDYALTCSIGIAHYPSHGEAPEDLIKNADTALYYVKERSKNDFKVFDQCMEHQSLERRILENALRKGIKEEQFYIEYQPKINMSTNELIGMEALVRWNHPDLGIISPGKFIPLAEETGLIVPLGEWILRESCRQTSSWQDQGFPPLQLSVNVSVRQLEDSHFVDKVRDIMNETGLEPEWLELEITESILANIKSTISILKEIQKLGIHISVDDFGTGYSSLSYIKEFPIDTLKIDQSFIKDIHLNKESKEIVKAIIHLAKSIGLNVIAEGIELKEHADELSKDGYILGQGYYFSRPLKVGAFEDYMKTVHVAS